MLGLFTSSVIMMVTRPTCCSMCRTAVSEVRIGCEDTLNFVWPRNVIEIKGLDTNDPTFGFKIDNLNEFVDWARETNGHDLRSLKEPYDFAMAAMFAALDALITAPSDASSGELVSACLSAVVKLGTAVKSRRKTGRLNIKDQSKFCSTELVACVRHEADTQWTWAKTHDR